MSIIKAFVIAFGIVGAAIMVGALCVSLWDLVIEGIQAGMFAGIYTIGVACTIIFAVGALILGDNLFDN